MTFIDNIAGEDSSMDAAVATIMGKIQAENGTAPKADARKVAADPDPTEYDGSVDLEQLERDQADAAAGNKQAKGTADADPDDQSDDAGTDAAAAEGDEIFELPPEAEGQEPVKMTKTEAIAAIRAQRQIQGDIANVINQAEAKYQAEQDTIINEIAQAHDVVITRAEAALRTMPRPQMPSELMKDPNSQYYDPQTYYVLRDTYDEQVKVIKQVQAEHAKATQQKDEALTAQEQIQNAREHERLARVWPEWKDTAKREAKAAELIKSAEKEFGISPATMAKMPFDHKLMQALDFALKAKQAPAKAVEVRKAVKESAAKMTNGQLPERNRTGQFTSETRAARDELRKTGSEEAFVNVLLRSGALKQR